MAPTGLESRAAEDRSGEPPPVEPSKNASKRHRHRIPDDRIQERLLSLRDALRAARQGDFSVRLQTDGVDHGLFVEVALAFNSWIELNDALVCELDRVS